MTTRVAVLLVAVVAVIGSACTSSAAPTTTTADTTTSTSVEPTTTTTTVAPTTTTTVPSLAAPEVGDPIDVAEAAFRQIPGFTRVAETTESDLALADLADKWIPAIAAKGISWDIVEDADGVHVVVYSISPLTGLRGYPWIANLFALFANENAPESSDANDVIEVEGTDGGVFAIWGEGDGVLIAMSETPAVATEYLEGYAATDEPNPVWSAGDCLYLPQDEPDAYGNAPWAPFALDLVVPCSGAHNAEVLLSEFVGTDLTEWDGPQIGYDRGYECDRAYAEEFNGNPQGEYLPSMITYMPDVDEWSRGDRYLACVVYIGGVAGSEMLFEGPMRDLPDLAWRLDPMECTEDSGKRRISCQAAHELQFLGSVTLSGDTYTVGGEEQDDACKPLGEGILDDDEGTEVIVTGFDLGAYQFEQGYRIVNCYAGALGGGGLVEVTGSFFDVWSVVDETAESA